MEDSLFIGCFGGQNTPQHIENFTELKAVNNRACNECEDGRYQCQGLGRVSRFKSCPRVTVQVQVAVLHMVCLVNSNLSDSVSVTWTFVHRSACLS